MARGRMIAAAAGAALVAGSLTGAPGPAGAQVPTDYQVLAGNFVGDSRDEAFYFAPDTRSELLVGYHKDPDGVAAADLLGEFAVTRQFTALAGDFDGDGFDEIFWYAPGTAADYMWNFTSGSTVQSTRYTVNPTNFRPTVGDYTGDGADDILWHAPGTAQDYIWEFNPGGGFRTVRPVVNGNFRPVSGSFGNDRTDDVIWYAPGTAQDYLWDFAPGTASYQSSRHAVNGTQFRPFSLDMFADGRGNEDVFWYAPGSGADWVWDFFQGVIYYGQDPMNGQYLAVSGDFFGDGYHDILWDNASESVIWEHEPGPSRTVWAWGGAAAADPAARAAGEAQLPSGPAVEVSSEPVERQR